jgi:hypothetical protein
MATYTINLDENIDLNELFSLNYNFEHLKAIIGALINSHRATNGKLKDFETLTKENEDKISEYSFLYLELNKN